MYDQCYLCPALVDCKIKGGSRAGGRSPLDHRGYLLVLLSACTSRIWIMEAGICTMEVNLQNRDLGLSSQKLCRGDQYLGI